MTANVEDTIRELLREITKAKERLDNTTRAKASLENLLTLQNKKVTISHAGPAGTRTVSVDLDGLLDLVCYELEAAVDDLDRLNRIQARAAESIKALMGAENDESTLQD